MDEIRTDALILLDINAIGTDAHVMQPVFQGKLIKNTAYIFYIIFQMHALQS